MSKRAIRWLLPILALLLIATIMVLSPIITTHAAGATSQPSAPHQSPVPGIYWYY
ncbi:MAG TPA: hypothetical protein VFB60_16905 [Ktedonobacteraceae bacterium]|nr:hypothetical protein [Ktedonobacteraceae bacterium]